MQMTGQEILVHFSHRYYGDWARIYSDIKAKTPLSDQDTLEAKDFLKTVSDAGISVVTVLDKEYPEILKKSPYMPFVLYYKGNLDLVKTEDATKNLVSIWSGKDDLTEYESTATITCSYDIYKAQSRCVTGISNRAAELAQKASLELLNAGVVILDTAFDQLSAAQAQLVKEVIDGGGLVLTTYPINTKPDIPDPEAKEHCDINLMTILGAGGSILIAGGLSTDKNSVNRISCWLSVASTIVDPDEIYAIMHDFTKEQQDCCNFLLGDLIKYGVKPYLRYHLLYNERQQAAQAAAAKSQTTEK